MIEALIGLLCAMLFLLLSSIMVAVIPAYLIKKKLTYEKRVVVEAVLWGLCSMVVFILNLPYFLINSFACAALTINGVKLVALPVLGMLKRSNKRRYIVLRRFMRKF
ncbi:hypothetical protein [Rossellomorea yichunensis]|uniref:hypothetical protein n=1 Tax=Rossellomorea yichunensis TaxID=3077331 RepID=UPI0028DEC724|nr:hypothetical protein [Rossellomorea sp. YC4-1]MDT9026797.1 hypothetical protein [Rossellomorea sp. YC4-1]